MKKWEKIEDAVNLYLIDHWKWFAGKIQGSLNTLKFWTKNQINKIGALKSTFNIEKIKINIYKTIHQIQEYSKKYPKYLALKAVPIIKNKKNVVSFVLLVSFGFFANKTWIKYRDIIDKNSPTSRAPASITDKNTRPSFYNDEKKQIKIESFSLPIMTDDNIKTKSIMIDFTVQLNTRYSKVMLESLHHELNDALNVETAPLVKDFPITNEGKLIIKNKIKETLNKLLERKNLKSKIKFIQIDSILSS